MVELIERLLPKQKFICLHSRQKKKQSQGFDKQIMYTNGNWEAAKGPSSDGGGTTRPLPRDGGAEELRGDPTVGPHPKV